MELCRVCVAVDTKMIQIFDSKDDINVMIQFCTGVLFTKQEGLPSKICPKCLEDLHTAHKFKQKCLNSENMFHNIVIKKIKEDPDSKTVDIKNDNSNNDTNDTTNCSKNDDIFNDTDLTDYDSSKEIKKEDEVVKKCVRKSTRVRKKDNIPKDESQLKPVARKQRGPYKKSTKPRTRKYKFRKLWCEPCSMKFNSKQDSDDHKKQFHNEQQICICEVCGKTFSSRASHHSHMRSHYAPQFACDHCDYKSTSKYDLEKHVRIHTGHKSYICPVCAFAFRTSSNLHSHVRLVHERVRRYACPLCARAFYDRTKLNRHVDSHNDVKRYSCEVCHACFSRRCYWKKHLQRQHDISIPAQRPGRRRGEIRPLPVATEA